MSEFSLDDIRESFVTDVEACTSRIESAFGRFTQVFPEGIVGELPQLDEAFDDASGAFHNIRGTTSLVGLNGFSYLTSQCEEACETAKRAWQKIAEQAQIIDRAFYSVQYIPQDILPYVDRLINEDRDEADNELRNLAPEFVNSTLVDNHESESIKEQQEDSRVFSFEGMQDNEISDQEVQNGGSDLTAYSFVESASENKNMLQTFNEERESFHFGESDGKEKEYDKPDPELLEIYTAEYNDSKGVLFAALEQFPDKQALREARRIFHQLKGASASIGLVEISQYAAKAEKMCDEERTDLKDAEILKVIANHLDPVESEQSFSDAQFDISQVFIIEVREALNYYEKLEKDDASEEECQLLSSLFHRLVGSALIIDYPEIAKASRQLSDWFAHQSMKLELPSDIESAIEVLRSFTDQFSAQENGQELSVEIPGQIQEEPPNHATISDNRVLWEVFTSESVEIRSEWEELVGELMVSVDPQQELKGLMRCAHTWKGAASSIGLGSLTSFIHLCEDFFSSYLGSSILPPLNDFVKVSTYCLNGIDYALKNAGVVLPEHKEDLTKAITVGLEPIGDISQESKSLVLESRSDDSSLNHDSSRSSQALQDKSLRIPLERIEWMIDGVSDLMVKKSQLQLDIDKIQGSQQNVQAVYGRLKSVLSEFASKNEFSYSGIESKDQDVFTQSEWDRYDSVNIFSRKISEIGDDLSEAHNQLGDYIENVDSHNHDFILSMQSLQEQMGSLRAVNLRTVFNRLRLSALESSNSVQKDVRVELKGQNERLDKVVVDRLMNPLVHVVRNSIAHGIESADERKQLGKNPEGCVKISAVTQAGNVIISISDDGRGLDRKTLHKKGVELGLINSHADFESTEVSDLIFHPGLSTSQKVDDLAGRGFGCDILQREVLAIGGHVSVESQWGDGTCFTLTLPISIAVTKVLFVLVDNQPMAIPLQSVEKAMAVDEFDKTGMMAMDGECSDVLSLAELFGITHSSERTYSHVISCVFGTKRRFIGINGILGREDIVVRNIGDFLNDHPAYSGMTIGSDGDPVLIIDPSYVVQHRGRVMNTSSSRVISDEPKKDKRPYILVVDDSISVRKIAERYLSSLPYEIITANDGRDALTKIRSREPSVIITDLEMPTMDGLSLIRAVRSDNLDFPIIVISSRSSEKHKKAAYSAGADAYLPKPFTEEALKDLVLTHLGRRENKNG